MFRFTYNGKDYSIINFSLRNLAYPITFTAAEFFNPDSPTITGHISIKDGVYTAHVNGLAVTIDKRVRMMYSSTNKLGIIQWLEFPSRLYIPNSVSYFDQYGNGVSAIIREIRFHHPKSKIYTYPNYLYKLEGTHIGVDVIYTDRGVIQKYYLTTLPEGIKAAFMLTSDRGTIALTDVKMMDFE